MGPLKINGFHRPGVRNAPKIELTPGWPEGPVAMDFDVRLKSMLLAHRSRLAS
jgi:hypothetical protein